MKSSSLFFLWIIVTCWCTGYSAWSDLGPTLMLGRGRAPFVATDASGHVHMVHTFYNICVYMKASPDGQFFAPETIPGLPDANNLQLPYLALDKQEVPHIVLQNGQGIYSKKLYYTNRTGNTWKQLKVLDEQDVNEEDRINVPNISFKGDTALIGYMARHGSGQTHRILMVVNLAANPTVLRIKNYAYRTPTPFYTQAKELYFLAHQGNERPHSVYRIDDNLNVTSTISVTNSNNAEAHSVFMAPDGQVHFCGLTMQGRIWYSTLARAKNGQNEIQTSFGIGGTGGGTFPHIARINDGSCLITYRDFSDNDKGNVVRIFNNSYSQPVTFADKVGRILRSSPTVAPLKDGGAIIAWYTTVVTTDYLFVRSIGNATFIPKAPSAVSGSIINQQEGERLCVYPNPVNLNVNIRIQCKVQNAKCKMQIYNVNGKMVAKLIANSQQLKAGIIWNAADCPSGVYFIRAKGAGKVLSKKIFLQ